MDDEIYTSFASFLYKTRTSWIKHVIPVSVYVASFDLFLEAYVTAPVKPNEDNEEETEDGEVDGEERRRKRRKQRGTWRGEGNVSEMQKVVQKMRSSGVCMECDEIGGIGEREMRKIKGIERDRQREKRVKKRGEKLRTEKNNFV